ncbi:MAG: type III pantothenate kinase [Dysgonamonadaceae bacterium]|jgi:type III pantothenate kinase|nr:type III pantothenate kinase [Dysgonamonadaceae bacterium]
MEYLCTKKVNIVIDQGNTSAKAAFFDKNKLLASFIFKPLRLEKLNRLLNEFSPSNGILSMVADVNPAIIMLLRERLNKFVLLDEHTPLPIRVEYRTPETLGRDRIAAAVGANAKHPYANLLVIDAGTAITYDLITDGVYRGGTISPGMTLRFKALHAYTRQLPMLDERGDIPDLGYDTATAIRSGVVNGIVKEMAAYIEAYKHKYPGLLVFLTGGHSFYFETRLKSGIFADGNLVLTGLNEILNYQYE